jgi:hypothetical protein
MLFNFIFLSTAWIMQSWREPARHGTMHRVHILIYSWLSLDFKLQFGQAQLSGPRT